MRYLVIALMFLVSACSTEPPVVYAKGFEEYVNRFNSYAEQYGSPRRATNIVIRFGDVKKIGELVVGVCYTGTGRPVVEIDSDFWNKADDYNREVLVLHELGHCVPPFEDHRTGVKSLMNPYLPWDYIFLHDYYLAEFFSGVSERSYQQNGHQIQIIDFNGDCGARAGD